ncbi:hypothetical protein MJO28_000596 [Puccinia striiformis f. sp. tritici]|uniref:Uncharacterized protein n=3 Tax=Puccinia striiformis TaxID=27350 RepID=A0A0L0W5V3_9BASI|nr:hypothetical protein Pst134EA_000650 [Puccinia striiformis f. sp. tritici]KAI9601139.1 hypothetical protein H4Q26_000943 [Puccinia striiformis f. sp. tritici PST-130]KNF06865.1 hypothetical protein PSTG_00182 [Puccinia striiformis f. sp. tritici PST-78]POW00973.1 hypothetical protein PSHT_12767 [Puccinia striiformis]KAH9473571.1 hypothetical protein Pst134EA_000650 [Puccinia striiformis f. sp. tritici]KAI7962502.1 hypothetical protein MJO28_000596 [Puccinia striiformis f. sp. tritici]
MTEETNQRRISLSNEWPPAPYGTENLPRHNTTTTKRKPSPTLLQSSCSNRPLKQLARSLSSLSTDHHPTFSFDFSSSGHTNQKNFANHHHISTKNHPQENRNKSGNQGLEDKITVAPLITLSLFTHLSDPTLSWSTKIGCFSATLGINFLLPFINGVMLGLGEIAAREFIGAYFGWGPAGYRYYSNQLEPHRRSSSSMPDRSTSSSSNPTNTSSSSTT